jgi:hypothetical protein
MSGFSQSRTLLRAGLLTALSDFTYGSVQGVFFYQTPFARFWQGVASVPFGRRVLDGGWPTVALGLACHVVVALWWTGVFQLGVMRLGFVKRAMQSPWGMAMVAAVYGPLVWATMSLAVIPVMLWRPPTITLRWLYQLIGHFPFVGLPIVWGTRRWSPANQ